MKTTYLFSELLNLFEFKTVHDDSGNEFVIYESSNVNDEFFKATKVEDKTQFEALENHVHLVDTVRKKDIHDLIKFGNRLGKVLLDRLAFCYHDKHFAVFVTITDSMIIRFHQKWEGEPYYFDTDNRNENEYLIFFEN